MGLRSPLSVLRPPSSDAPVAVLVLGGGYYVSDRDLYGFALCDGGSRILTVLELLRTEKASALVLGGGLPVPGRPGVTAPSLVESWVLAWGLARTAGVVTNLGTCLNTHDEAVQFLKLEKAFGWWKVLLVTSALHMPRSVALFKKQGIEVEPVACDFKVYGVPGALRTFSPFPRQSGFQVLGRYLEVRSGGCGVRKAEMREQNERNRGTLEGRGILKSRV